MREINLKQVWLSRAPSTFPRLRKQANRLRRRPYFYPAQMTVKGFYSIHIIAVMSHSTFTTVLDADHLVCSGNHRRAEKTPFDFTAKVPGLKKVSLSSVSQVKLSKFIAELSEICQTAAAAAAGLTSRLVVQERSEAASFFHFSFSSG